MQCRSLIIADTSALGNSFLRQVKLGRHFVNLLKKGTSTRLCLTSTMRGYCSSGLSPRPVSGRLVRIRLQNSLFIPFLTLLCTIAILIKTSKATYMWDCNAFLSKDLFHELLAMKPPLAAIAISHPHVGTDISSSCLADPSHVLPYSFTRQA